MNSSTKECIHSFMRLICILYEFPEFEAKECSAIQRYRMTGETTGSPLYCSLDL